MQEDPGPNAEADKTQKCMVQSCKEKAATKLYNDPQVIGDVIKGCKEREEHGNFTYQTTLDYVKKVGEENISMFKYHSNCVKPIKNAKNLGIIRKNNPKRDAHNLKHRQLLKAALQPKTYKSDRKGTLHQNLRPLYACLVISLILQASLIGAQNPNIPTSTNFIKLKVVI